MLLEVRIPSSKAGRRKSARCRLLILVNLLIRFLNIMELAWAWLVQHIAVKSYI